MNALAARFLCVALLTSSVGVVAQDYPEFNGNYAKCDSGWCEVPQKPMNVVTMWQDLRAYSSKPGKNAVVYHGFFKIPKEAFAFSTKFPRYILNSGRQTADPATIALVEFGKMPFNGAQINAIDGDSYGGRAAYTVNSFGEPMWVFKREIPIRYKVIEGKVGMIMIEPREPLSDGFYGVDTGRPGPDGHQGLRSMPSVMDFMKEKNIQPILPFVVGDVQTISSQDFMASPPDIEFSGRRITARHAGNASDNSPEMTSSGNRSIDEAVSNFVDGLFGGNKKAAEPAASAPSN